MKSYGLARLGRDCEVRTTPQGESVTELALAFTWGKKDSDGKRNTVWVSGSLWGKRAEALAPYLLKGGLVVATLDDVHIETYRKNDGTDAVKMVGRVSDIELAGGNDRPAQAPAPRPAAPAPRPTPARPPSGFEDMDDDMFPF